MELNGKIINFLGDSITEGCGLPSPEFAFPALIEKRCGLLRANNYGIGGSRIARQQASPNDPDYCSRFDRMEKDADLIVVMGGTNDHGHGDAPLGTFEDRTPDTFYGACHSLMRGLLEQYPEAVTVICTPTHNLWEAELHRNQVPLSVYIDILREVAAFYSLPVLDLWQSSGIQPQIPVIRERYMPDGCHPSIAGHERLADRIVGFLSRL